MTHGSMHTTHCQGLTVSAAACCLFCVTSDINIHYICSFLTSSRIFHCIFLQIIESKNDTNTRSKKSCYFGQISQLTLKSCKNCSYGISRVEYISVIEWKRLNVPLSTYYAEKTISRQLYALLTATKFNNQDIYSKNHTKMQKNLRSDYASENSIS